MKHTVRKRGGQMSEAFANAIFLTLSGGLQDAYTYCCRGEVFANAQTGNIVLMSANLFQGQWGRAMWYLIPLFSFVAGIFAAEAIRRRYKTITKVHWRQLILLGEIVLLFAVGFLPQVVNIAANALVSFVCAMQVQAFRKVNGNAYASTMCIGNMRNGTEALCAYFHTKERAALRKGMQYFGIILLFAAGAGTGSLATKFLQERAIWLSCLLLAVSFCMMFIREEIVDEPKRKALEKELRQEITHLEERILPREKRPVFPPVDTAHSESTARNDKT